MEEREALTVRLRLGLLAQVKLHKLEGESLNDLIVKALEREMRYRQGLATHHRIAISIKSVRV